MTAIYQFLTVKILINTNFITSICSNLPSYATIYIQLKLNNFPRKVSKEKFTRTIFQLHKNNRIVFNFAIKFQNDCYN